jgi:hypothetical protein
MTTDQLLADLAQWNITLSVDGGRLRYRAPVGVLTTQMREAIAARRDAILERLCRKSHEPTVRWGGKCRLCDYRSWIDQPSIGGKIRTICGECGRFIGYRPVGL